MGSEDAFPGFHQSTLYRDTDVLVVPAIIRVGKLLRRVDAFLGARHIAVVGDGGSSDQIDDWLATLGVRRNTAIARS